MIEKVFNHTSYGIIAGASILAIFSVVSRALGFVRNALLASSFGAGDILDAYFLAFRLPDFVFNILFFGALSAGFVPVFMKLYAERRGEAWRLANDIFNLALVGFSVFGVIFFFAAPWILPRIAPGFSDQTLQLAITMSRIMFLQPIFLGISGIFSGVLQSARKFLSYALAPIFYNLGIIFGILVLVRIMGPTGLAWGVVVGAIAHLAIQYPAVRASGWQWRLVLLPGLASLKRVLKIMVPRSLALIVGQINLIILISLATVLGAGSVAIFNFANDLYSFSLGIVVVPLGIAAFPAFIRAVGKSKQALGEVFVRTMRQLLFVLIPLAVMAFILRAQVVRLTLGYGNFAWPETVLTIETLAFFLVGLIFHGILGIVMRAYFALEDAKTPLIVLSFGMVITVTSAIWLRELLGLPGLALGMAIGMIFNSLVLLFIFARRIELKNKLWSLLHAFYIFLITAAVAGLAARGMLFLAVDYLVTTEKVWGLFVQATLATIVGGTVYIVASHLMGVPEVKALRVKLGLRLPRETAIKEGVEERLPR